MNICMKLDVHDPLALQWADFIVQHMLATWRGKVILKHIFLIFQTDLLVATLFLLTLLFYA